MTKTPIVFVRHGETKWNREFRYQGQRDIPLNDLGRRQAARNGRAVAGILKEREWRLVASPLSRAMETMRIVLDNAGCGELAFATDDILMEANYGDWEGLTAPDIARNFPDQDRARDKDKWGYAPPNGESYAMVAQRVSRWLAGVAEPTFVVAHGGILRALLHLLMGLPPHDAPHLYVPQDRVFVFAEATVLTI